MGDCEFVDDGEEAGAERVADHEAACRVVLFAGGWHCWFGEERE